MSILMKYVKCLMQRGVVDECHVWDYSRNMVDYKYLLRECSQQSGHHGIHLMTVKNKGSWTEYYDHYAERYGDREDVVLIKCDDDIVYIDVDAMPAFISFRVAHPEILFTFPTIINNGLVANLQQRPEFPNPKHRIAAALSEACPHEFELKKDGFETLVKDGRKAAWLHEWFLTAEESSRSKHVAPNTSASDPILIDLGQRISINFFAVLSKDLKLFAPQGGIQDDERFLSQQLPTITSRHNCICADMTVSHFAFCSQRNTGLDGVIENAFLARYDAMACWPESE